MRKSVFLLVPALLATYIAQGCGSPGGNSLCPPVPPVPTFTAKQVGLGIHVVATGLKPGDDLDIAMNNNDQPPSFPDNGLREVFADRCGNAPFVDYFEGCFGPNQHHPFSADLADDTTPSLTHGDQCASLVSNGDFVCIA